MEEKLWDEFVTYVNLYYAIQQACMTLERRPEGAPAGLEELCSEANPFLWDAASSADPELYQDFSRRFEERFDGGYSTSADGLDFCRDWLRSLEGGRYGSGLVSSFDSVVTDPSVWDESYPPISEQVNNRMVMNELSPQDVPGEFAYGAGPVSAPTAADRPAKGPAPRPASATGPASGPSACAMPSADADASFADPSFEEFASRQATLADVPAVAAMLAGTQGLHRSDLERYLTRNMQQGALAQQVAEVDGRVVSTAGVLFVEVIPSAENPSGMVGLVVGVSSLPGYEATLPTLLEDIELKASGRGVSRLFLYDQGERATDACLDYGFESEGDLLSLLV
ncbi:MAG: hypothetical protein PUE38_09085 [Olsenella sp.]|nr:hypothetical protein [Olsenella sp.]